MPRSQVRRICDQGRVAAVLQDLAHVGGPQPLLTVRAAQHLLSLPDLDAARDLAEQVGGASRDSDKGPVGVGMAQLLDQLGDAERDALTGGLRDLRGAQLVQVYRLDVNNPGPPPRNLTITLALALDSLKESRIVLDGLHRQREGRKLRRASVHVRPMQVLLQDQAGNPPARISCLVVHVPQDVEGISEHVPGPTGRVDDAEVLRVGDRQALVLLPLGRGHQVLEALPEHRVRVGAQPLHPQCVLHEVAHHPVRGEELRDGSQRILVDLDTGVVDLLLAGGNVELVEPADDLNVHAPGLIGADRRHDIGAHGLPRGQEVRGWNQVRPVIRLREHSRHNLVPRGEVLTEQQDICIQIPIIEE